MRGLERSLVSRALVLWLAPLLLLALPASAAPFSRVFAFGDSYTDSGNWVRVTNGPVWLEYLGERLGMPDVGLARELGGDNYAVSAGSATGSFPFDLEAQLTRYFADHPSGDPEALYLLFIGWNDLAVGADRGTETAAAVTRVVDRLIAHGASRVVVLEVSNKATTPRFLAADPEVRADLTAQVFEVNLTWQLDALTRDAWTDLIDIYALTTEVYLDPAAFGFEDATGHCDYDPVCAGYVWWDDVHPTTAFHRVIARRVLARMLDLPEDAVDALSPQEIEQMLAPTEDAPADPSDCVGGEALPACLDLDVGPWDGSEDLPELPW